MTWSTIDLANPPAGGA